MGHVCSARVDDAEGGCAVKAQVSRVATAERGSVIEYAAPTLLVG